MTTTNSLPMSVIISRQALQTMNGRFIEHRRGESEQTANDNQAAGPLAIADDSSRRSYATTRRRRSITTRSTTHRQWPSTACCCRCCATAAAPHQYSLNCLYLYL